MIKVRYIYNAKENNAQKESIASRVTAILTVNEGFFHFIKLQPAIFPLSQHVIRFHELPADTTQRFLQ